MKSPTLSHVGALPIIALLLALFCVAIPTSAQTFTDAGFTAETVLTLTRFNTIGFTFAPDGRIFTWEKPGVVRIVKNGVLLPTPFLDISSRVYSQVDSGLIGLALDPNFATNGFVYLLYVFEPSSPPTDTARTARLTRVKADLANPDVAQANSEIVLMGKINTAPCSSQPAGADCMASDSGAHTVGTVKFGPDGKIYVGMGDGASFTVAEEKAFRSQDLNYYNGKILRINPDGTAPSDNPFYDGNPNSVRSKVYAYGLRSPYRFALKPGTGEVYIGDVGAAKFEEINRGRGANFGWPCYEGPNPQFSFQNAFPQTCAQLAPGSVTFPLYSYPWNGGSAVVAGPFYTGTQFPTQYRGNFFFADFVQGFIRRMVFDANNNVTSVETFATNVVSPVHLEQGPDGFLYYMVISTGELRRIRFSGTAPVAVATATRPSAVQPYTVAFSSAGSSGGSLTYSWQFGDGATSTAANPTHTYTTTGSKTFTASLTVTNAQGLTASTTVDIVVGGQLPVATITSPAEGTRVKIGTTVTFTGTASDPDEVLPTSAMKWVVLLHHNEHIHPGITATGPSGSFVVENHGSTGETYFYEIVLTVTDSAGLTDTKRINVWPENSTATLPAPWVGQEVGNVGLPGLADYANGVFTMKGSGVDITDFNDGFYYVYQKLSGDGEIKARVTSVQNTAFGSKAGVMMRAALTGNAAHTLMSLSPTEGLAFERRNETGFGTALVSSGYFAAPRWVRLVRSGNTISGYHSADGVTWALVSSTVINLPTEVFVGLAVTAVNNAALCTATFDNVSITTPGTNRAPTVSLTTPANNATFSAPADISFVAAASDSDGTISKVEFYRGATLVRTELLAPYEVTLHALPIGTYTMTAKAYDNKGEVTTSSPVQVTVTNVINGTGTGLRGEYFNRENLTDLRFTRTDSVIDFDWGTNRPISSLGKDHFSVRWTGFVQPRFSGSYTFYVKATDTVRLWVNNQLLVSKTSSTETESRGTITLTAGQKYALRLEFAEKDKAAAVQLDWSSAAQARQVIPKSQLYLP